MEAHLLRINWHGRLLNLEIMQEATWVITAYPEQAKDEVLIAVAPYGYASKDFDCEGWYHYDDDGNFNHSAIELELGYMIKGILNLMHSCPSIV